MRIPTSLMLLLAAICAEGCASTAATTASSEVTVGPEGLRGTRTFCVFVTKGNQLEPTAADILVASLREKAPELSFVTSRTECAAADAVFAYDVGEWHGFVYQLTPRGQQRIFINRGLGIRPDPFIDEFIGAWRSANSN